jgi:N-acetyl-gamma-glutamyl-phosphate reductase
MIMTNVAIVGASGYTGVELARLLISHPEAHVTCLTSRQYTGVPFSEVFPSMRGALDLKCDPVDIDLICSKADLVFTALPHKTAMEVVPQFLAAGKKVIDLSADYRLHDAQTYCDWYQAHTSPELLAEAVYGLPELYRDKISGARLIANPGCYPTGAALALAPLVQQRLVDNSSLIIDSKSGTSGAGRVAKEGSLFCEVNESFKAYGVAQHRHTPEIEQTLSGLSGEAVTVSFTPHLLPVSRGILTTCYASLTQSMSTEAVLAIFQETYADEPFVRVLPLGKLPDVGFVRGSNYCDIGVVSDERTGRVIVVSAIDNLVKGAAGQAVQNMNILLDLDETTGLNQVGLFP